MSECCLFPAGGLGGGGIELAIYQDKRNEIAWDRVIKSLGLEGSDDA